ncbi:MAG TPA: carboxypeptidase regulatory-like domain-containing protein [Sphingobacteriaceae bacterium]|nr:carboxypeptidase regulatory-like domain-containing protein [Sphingobacteriaceae bacterium]
MRKSLLLMMMLFVGMFVVHAQVTTSSMSGLVSQSSGQAVSGATVKATHVPSGTSYSTSANAAGRYNIANMRVGGPYRLEVTYIGQDPVVYEDVFLQLGQPFVLNVEFGDNGLMLDEVAITARRNPLNIDKTGTSTNISPGQINSLPSFSRSITDFTRLTPQANGNSFAGRDGRYNNVQIDGANFNNGFGLNDAPLPGGGGLSIDAIEQIQVNIAPYDVRQGGFTGAGINAVTRSGTNTFQGSVYHFNQNDQWQGTKVKGDLLSGLQASAEKTWGFRLGGPIIKDKLFFFVNAEQINLEGPAAGAVNPWRASEDGIADPANNITRVRRSDLEAVKNHLMNQWGYDPGRYEGYADGKSAITSLLARIDWNISNNHKLAVRVNSTENEIPALTNGTSGAYPRASGSFSRVSQNAMSFENSMYFNANKVFSTTLELNSRFNNNVSNQFLATYSKIESGRSSPSAEFPFIDIGDGQGTSSTWQNYISAGYELFTYNNAVVNDNYIITNNVNISTGKHEIVVGASFEMQQFKNNYMRNGTSYYRYGSVEEFLATGTPAEQAPLQFALTYPYPGQEPWAIVNYALPSIYVQDKISLSDRFTLTAGVRAEIPMFTNSLAANPVVDQLDLLNLDGQVTNYASGEWPKTRLMISPRVGFRWNAHGDNSLIVRGGTGMFAGRVPFVWLTNQPSNTGAIQNGIEPGSYNASAPWISGIRFNPDKLHWLENTPAGGEAVFIDGPGDGVPGSLALVSENFKMPQIYRANIGADQKIGETPLTLVADVMYTKDLNDVYQFGANRKEATQTMYDGRAYYENSAAYTYNPSLGGNAGSVLSNTSMGHSFNVSVGLNLDNYKGLSGALSYSHTSSQTTTDNSGSNASSAWGATPHIGSPNDIFLASSINALPHRVVGFLAYELGGQRYGKTTLSLYYSGSHQGRYSFTYNGDVNGDAIGGDLLYIPNNASEINFVQSGNFTVAQQVEAFDQLMNNVPYLKDNKGRIADRNAVLMPWYNRFDFRVLQDLFTNIGGNKNTIQLSFDFVNFANLLNSDWGVRKQLIPNASTPLSVVDRGTNPTFRMNTANIDGNVVLPTEMYQDVRTFGTTWSMQFGIRYIFN